MKLINVKDLIPRTLELFKKKIEGDESTIFNGYSLNLLGKDCISGIIVAIVALPLSMAFSIAAGASPAQGIYTAIIAGFFISALGGSRFQIGGPTGAFVVIIFNVIATNGMSGLLAATILAGVFLVLMGVFGLGRFIKYIPYPVTTGFTTGIGLLIFSQQMKDFFGLNIEKSSPEFINKWIEHFEAAASADLVTLTVGLGTMAIIIIARRFAPRVPSAAAGVLVMTLVCTVAKALLQDIPFERLDAYNELERFFITQVDSLDTISTRFGGIPQALPHLDIPPLSFAVFQNVFPAALSIALLAAIESLLSAVVSDSMSGDKHNSNTELFAQGIANIASAIFGGIPATGAIARTATNIKSGAVSPVSGIVHAIVLLLFVLFLAPAASAIPLASLSAVLIIVAWDMSNVPRFIRIIRTAPKSDTIVLVITFLLTVLVDLSYAVVIGVLLAIFLFMRRMVELGGVRTGNDALIEHLVSGEKSPQMQDSAKALFGKDTELIEINGPFFFGIADMLQGTLGSLGRTPKKIVLRMRFVPAIDSTGIAALESFLLNCRQKKIRLIITECNDQPKRALEKSGFLENIGAGNFLSAIEDAADD
ncbi:MAG: STAS domain-containing protein [Spirochaetaceae bacterium]|jgi:SulP family sulfate permease|nr:STAS domain-containing protein [Spirochaetaceae bacterium]